MNDKYKKILLIAALPLLLVAYFFDNIKGQYRFMQYCKNEGGLHIYERLEKNVGWRAEDYQRAKTAAQIKHVGFVRFVDVKGDGKEYDLRYKGSKPNRDSSFERTVPDPSANVVYIWQVISEGVPGEIRLGRTSFQVLENNSNKLLVSFHSFGYSQFNQNNSILGAPSGVDCYWGGQRSQWLESINTSFSDKNGDEE